MTPALVLGPVVAPPPRPPPPPSSHPLSVQVLAGGVLAGGDNRGPLASLGVGYQLPPLNGRFALEAEAGLRRSTSHPLVEGLGTVDSRVLAYPLLFSVRGLAFELGRFSLYGRVGAGPTYYNHRATSSFFDTPLVQQGRTFMGFVAAQAVWRLGAVSTLLEVRAGRAAASASLVDAQLGGLSACVGLRYRL